MYSADVKLFQERELSDREKHTDRGKVVGVAMSGGVDSSVAAALLHQQGYDVIGLTMHLWTDESGRKMFLNRTSGCCSVEMAQDAARVAEKMDFRHYTLDLSKDFHQSVIRNFGKEYLSGRTPNPCVRCNTFVKWQALMGRARRMGCDYFATGHYARVSHDGDRSRLWRAGYLEKDQSYALWGITQEGLSRTLLPLGELDKNDVRQLAADLGLATAGKPDSQDICFVPDNDYRRFMDENFGSEMQERESGEIIGPGGQLLGHHDGITNFTIGQRKGLRVSVGRPLFVKRIDTQTNRIYVDDEDECRFIAAGAFDVNWVSVDPPQSSLSCHVKIRYRDKPHPAVVIPDGDSRVYIEFTEPVRAVTPGQSAVFYDGDLVLGGGVLTDPQPVRAS